MLAIRPNSGIPTENGSNISQAYLIIQTRASESDTLSRHAQFVGQKSESPSRALPRANARNMKADLKSSGKLNVKLSTGIDRKI
jgi:hypothetical protein